MPYTDKNRKELEEEGYTVVEGVLDRREVDAALTMFRDWQLTIPDNEYVIRYLNPRGIYKFHNVGHQKHAWFIRTRDGVQAPFRDIWGTRELAVSFDGTGYMPQWYQGVQNSWMHCDQSPDKKGLHCVQGLVSLTKNMERTFVVYPKTHKYHEEYCESRGLVGKEWGDWVKIDEAGQKYVTQNFARVPVRVNAGDMVLWDSRTIHENQSGPEYHDARHAEERIVQYVSYLPKNDVGYTEDVARLRQLCFEEKRTTNHWAYPVGIVPLQPSLYGNVAYEIDYNQMSTIKYGDELLEKMIELI